MKIIDFHCDTISKIYYNNSQLNHNSFSVDITKLKKSNSLAQFFALFIEKKSNEDPFDLCSNMLNKFYCELDKNKEHISLATNYDELIKNKSQNKISAFLTIEEGAVLKGDLLNLKHFHERGVRLITLTWNFPNEIGYPNAIPKYKNKGLTPFGIELINDMNNLNMIIDVSHLSDGGFYDVAKYSKAPFVASHSNARSITNHSRNLTDDMIKTLANKGGVIGINFFGEFLGGGKFSRINDMLTHIKHIKNIGGIEVISLGSDFDGIDSILEIDNIGEIHKLIDALKVNGFTENDIEKICYKNALRIIKEIC
ncbi:MULTISPECIES: dipeptidase [Clostridium]|uniref:Renal dipeptidase n=1 Tax=Clostridium novyi (strain NT) TaxID=386415 RepID=A0PY63_CLONN|nr:MULTISPECIES: dipeptidase [Clostridium]ABK61430.1 Renal dipeptidase [Clostridium novyi NT]KEH87879.1 peptidase M19 [Clostridium novyi A str. NCTC 538]KEH90106.1 peptidase M19 [Clostridium novyi A str. 4540]KEH91254.1 peptidase M19 [Clostridium novyi A str. BKT29909]KEH94657.1 peptidase M19 [Clostridium botulinum C/D str. It1]